MEGNRFVLPSLSDHSDDIIFLRFQDLMISLGAFPLRLQHCLLLQQSHSLFRTSEAWLPCKSHNHWYLVRRLSAIQIEINVTTIH